jgi:hypothetical protein
LKKKEANYLSEKTEFKLTKATEFDILSKKIICKFYQNALFTRLSYIDYESQIKGQGDAVQMQDQGRTMLIVDRAIPIEEKRNPRIFKDITMIDIVTTRIAKQLQEEVEKAIVKAGNSIDGRSLCFAGAIVPMGGFSPREYEMKFVYGFKIQ